MTFEKLNAVETMGPNRQKLLNLEREGKYVFHGSPDDIQVLEPRQAFNMNPATGQMEPHGEPEVFATPYADVAIFRALINAKGIQGESESSFGIEDDKLHFSATKNLLDKALIGTGKVYVLDKSRFGCVEGMQCQSSEAAKPLQIIEVAARDLPDNIKFIEE